MSRAKVRASIARRVRDEALTALARAAAPTTASAVHRSCATSAEVDDAQQALRELVAEGRVAQVTHRNKRAYRLISADCATRPGQSNADSPTRDVAAVLAAAGEWLTRDQICSALRQYSREQIGQALKDTAVSMPQAGSNLRLYGLADWHAEPPSEREASAVPDGVYAVGGPSPTTGRSTGRSARVIQAIRDADAWMTIEDLAACLTDARDKIGKTLSYHAGPTGSGQLVGRRRVDSALTEYGLPAWADPVAGPFIDAGDEQADVETAAVDASRCSADPGAPRFALWSDGRLSVDTSDGLHGELQRPDVSALLAYLAEVTPGTTFKGGQV